MRRPGWVSCGADAAPQLLRQGQGQLPRRQQHGLALRVVAAVVDRVEQPDQLGGRLVVLPAVRVGHRPPVVDRRLQLRPQAQHQIEHPVRLAELGGGRLALHQQRAGPVQAEVEIDQGQRLRIVGDGVEVERAVDVPDALEGQLVFRVEGEGAAERLEGAAVAAHLGEAHAAEGVLHHAQPGQGAEDVDGVQADGDQIEQVADVGQGFGVGEEGPFQDADAQRQAGAHGGDVRLRLVLTAGQDQDAEQCRARQDLHGEQDLGDRLGLRADVQVGQVGPLAKVAELAEPEQHAARHDDRQQQAVDQPCHLPRDLAQQAEHDAQPDAAAQHRRQHRVVPRPRMNPVQSDDCAGQDAQVNQPGAFEQEEQEEKVGPAAHAEPLAQPDASGDRKGDRQPGHGGKVELGEVRPGIPVRRGGGLIQSGVQHQAEEEALEEVFGSEPAHGWSPFSRGGKADPTDKSLTTSRPIGKGRRPGEAVPPARDGPPKIRRGNRKRSLLSGRGSIYFWGTFPKMGRLFGL